MDEKSRGTRTTWGVVALVGLTVATWWLWLGLDAGYEVDTATGVSSGPYEAWQVVGCVICLAVLAVVGGLLLPAWLVVVSMTLAFTVAWSVEAAGRDETGMWGVGAILVFVGMASGSALLSFGAWYLRGRRS